MAEVTLPAGTTGESWLDRPLFPTWQRITALAVHWEIAAYASLVLAGFILRIWDLGGRAMHHDESLHAYYAWQLFTGHGYSYSPMMHGPLQFEVVPLFYLLFGDSEFSARLLAVCLGTALIVLPYLLRQYMTRGGAILAAAMLTISPALVYFSRFIRDDIYLACFSLILFIAIVRYLDRPRPHYLYVAAAAMALAMASMEAAYITFFIFGTFLIFQGIREFMSGRNGPVLAALRATSLDTWLMSLSIFVVLTVLLYSTFFTNPYGIWDTQNPLCLRNCFSLHPLWSDQRRDVLGGITYWLAQQGVERGGQPWFYYLLLLPLYEQLALVFGLAGLAYAAVRRTLVRTFMVWWAVLAFALYSWAGEKMPWLSIHIALPLILLAGMGLASLLSSSHRWLVAAAGVLAALLFALEIHSSFVLNYVDGADATEMMVYVQTSQDVPPVVHEIGQLAAQHGGAANFQIGLDDSDVGGWPFTWYLRNYPNVTPTSVFNGPICGSQYCPVLLMLDPQFNQYGGQLMSHYVAQKYRWNWWFPEDYKDWFPQHWEQGKLAPDTGLLGTSQDRMDLWNWLMYRRPFGYRGARWLYFLVRRDLVPGAKYYSTRGPQPIGIPTLPSVPTLPASLVHTLGSTGVGLGQLDGPRGMGAGPSGDLYVADTLNHRVVEYSPAGRVLRAWGRAGTGKGEFALRDSPQGLGVGPDGEVYVADTWNQRIEVFSAQGRFLRQWGGPPIGAGAGQFYGPRSVAVSPRGRVYVADTGNRRIQVFGPNGRYLYSFGTAGSTPGQLQEPSAIAVGPSGEVYVADFWNQRIQAFRPSGALLRSWRVPDWQPQSYDEPYLSVDPRNGNVLATDPQRQQVLEYTRTGQLLGSFTAPQLTLPIGIAAQPRGQVAVSDSTANHVVVFELQPTARPRAVRAPRPAGRQPRRNTPLKP